MFAFGFLGRSWISQRTERFWNGSQTKPTANLNHNTNMLIQTPKVGDLVLYRYHGTRTDIPFRVTQVNEAKGTILANDEAPGGYGSETHEFDMCQRGLTNFPTDKVSQDLVFKKLKAYAKRAGAI